MISRIALFSSLLLMVFAIIFSIVSTASLNTRVESMEKILADHESKYTEAMKEHKDMTSRINTLWLEMMGRELQEDKTMTDQQKAFFYE